MGIGGDPVPGSSFVDMIELFEADEQTELIVLSGEIGGSAEEEAADYIAEHVTKPVVAYIAGFTAPAGKQMGHAGAIVSGSAGTAAAKAEALEAKGVRVGRTPTEVAEIAVAQLGARAHRSYARAVDQEVSKTLGELERKLRELERTLTSIDRARPAQRAAAGAVQPQARRASAAGSDEPAPRARPGPICVRSTKRVHAGVRTRKAAPPDRRRSSLAQLQSETPSADRAAALPRSARANRAAS